MSLAILRKLKQDRMMDKLYALKSILIIQQSDDPVGSYSMLTSTIPKTSLCKMVEVQGNDHRYSDIEDLKLIIETWFRTLTANLNLTNPSMKKYMNVRFQY